MGPTGPNSRSLPLHIVDGSRSTMFDSMPSHPSKISFPTATGFSTGTGAGTNMGMGTFALGSFSVRSQTQTQMSGSDIATPSTPSAERSIGYGLPETIPEKADYEAEPDSAVDGSSSKVDVISVNNYVSELPQLGHQTDQQPRASVIEGSDSERSSNSEEKGANKPNF